MSTYQYPALRMAEIDRDPESLSKTEAKKHFEKFVGLCDSRVSILKQAYAAMTGRPESDLDETPESLSPLWEWIINIIALRNPSESEIASRRNRLNNWIKSLVGRGADINENDAKKLAVVFSVDGAELVNDTKTLALDVGYYFSKVLRKKFPEIVWRMETKKKFADYNKPTLALIPSLSSSPYCDPYRDVSRCFAEYLRDRPTNNLLLRKYSIYERELTLYKEKNSKL